MYTKDQLTFIKKAQEAAQTFYFIIRQFERGRISAAEMDKEIFQTVAQHKYALEYTWTAREAIKAEKAIDYIKTMNAEITKAAKA